MTTRGRPVAQESREAPAATVDQSQRPAEREVVTPDLGAGQDRTDLRLAPAGLAGWAAGWLAPLASPSCIAQVASVLAAGAIGLAVAIRLLPRWTALRWSVVAALAVAAAVLGVAALNAARAAGSVVDELAAERAVVTVDLRITSDATRVRSEGGPPMAEPLLLLRADVVDIIGRGQQAAASAPVVVLASDPAWASLTPSSIVHVVGRLGPNDRVSREVAVLQVAAAPELVAPPSLLQRSAEHLRAGLRAAVAHLPPDARGLLPGLVDGDDSRMPDDLADAAKTTGLTHLTAVSGANVSIVLGVVLALARWCGLRALAVPAAGVVGLAGFVVLARPDPSVIRASVMGVVVLVGMATGTRRRRLSGLCAAVVVLLLVDPWLARSYGFALSVLASGAIVTLVPGWTERWSRWLPAPLAAALAVPVAAQLVCGPVVVLLSDQVSVVAVLANLLAAPAVAPATVLGVVIAVIQPVAAPLAKLIASVAALPVSWIAWDARWFADRPYATIDWPSGATGAAALAAATVVSVLVVPTLVRRPPLLAAVLLAPVLTFFGVRAVAPAWPPTGWLVVACDVGQGDGLVVSAAPGTAIVVDTGSEPRAIDSCLRRLGVQNVALLLLTHPHADHIGGVLGVLANRQVSLIGIGTSGSIGAATPELGAAMTRAGAQVQSLAAGWSARIGPVLLEVLWPPADPTTLTRLDPSESAQNNSSVVARVTVADVTMLLTGDVEPSAQRAIVRSGVDLDADILKVPHHGSRYQDVDFLAASGASVALVSVGVDNDYGHPSAATLDALEAAGARVFRTDTGGSLAVGGTAGRLRVASTQQRAGALVAVNGASFPRHLSAAAPAAEASAVATASTAASSWAAFGDVQVCRQVRMAMAPPAVGARLAPRLQRSTGGVGVACDAGQRWRPRAPPPTPARADRASC